MSIIVEVLYFCESFDYVFFVSDIRDMYFCYVWEEYCKDIFVLCKYFDVVEWKFFVKEI